MNRAASSRRGFLRGLVSLPLIGGGVTLIGTPTAAAVPVTVELLKRYHGFLLAESAEALVEIEGLKHVDHIAARQADRREWCEMLHWYDGLAGRPDIAELVRGTPPGTRAAVVLGAAGCQP